MTVTLWQRNLIGALVAAVALALVVYVTPLPLWERYRRTVEPAHTVAAQRSITLDGQTWELGMVRTAGRTPGSGQPLPKGTVTKVVTVERSGQASTPLQCNAVLTDGQRRWRSFGPACANPGPLTWDFLVPADTAPTAIDIIELDGSILIRFQL